MLGALRIEIIANSTRESDFVMIHMKTETKRTNTHILWASLNRNETIDDSGFSRCLRVRVNQKDKRPTDNGSGVYVQRGTRENVL